MSHGKPSFYIVLIIACHRKIQFGRLHIVPHPDRAAMCTLILLDCGPVAWYSDDTHVTQWGITAYFYV